MKSLIFGLASAIILLSFTVAAQNRLTPQERLKNLKERLNLTEDQSVNVEKILETSNDDIQKLRSTENPDRTEFRKIMDNTNQEILKVLNEKQKIEFNKILEERQNRRQRNSGNKNQ
jgi:outer membrane lipoprotein-sorting protein